MLNRNYSDVRGNNRQARATNATRKSKLKEETDSDFGRRQCHETTGSTRYPHDTDTNLFEGIGLVTVEGQVPV